MGRGAVAVCVIFATLLALLPQLASEYYIALATKMIIFALLAMSLDLLLGYTGLASLGHAAFFGVGAYTVALLLLRANVNPWLAMPLGIVAATGIGALFGVLALRARGSYFLMITLALSQVLWGIAFGWRSLTRGDDGLPDVPRPDFGGLWSLASNLSFYYFVLIVAVLAAGVLLAVVNSPFGHALRGIRESETRMSALGYDVWRYKYGAFVLAALFAGLAGCLYAYYNRFVSPDYLHVVRSAEALIMVILGGAGTLIGPAIGAATIVFLEDTISSYTEHWLLVLGLIYVAVTLFAPQGIVGFVREWRGPGRSR